MDRPKTITVFGALNVLFGVYGLVRGGFTLRALFGMGGAEISHLFDRPLLTLGVLLGMAVSGALGLSGISLLRMRPWARQCSILYGVCILLATILFYIGQYVSMLLGAGAVRAAVEAVCNDGLFGMLAGTGTGSIKVDVTPGVVNAVVPARTTDFIGLVYALLLAVGMFRGSVTQALATPNAREAAGPKTPPVPAE
ncbi:MAG TPA: hypothetical protein PLO37_10615 [Candidatus Hydrogenedentes bacterium]|nr:hypothetical protein [Candidatus Hydrogenedentota bacterium]HPG67288.1 hypothetical protein [Candidatus Hydrogenedentota bacterium]